MKILVFNAGSTSLHVVLDEPEVEEPRFHASAEWPGGDAASAFCKVFVEDRECFSGPIDATDRRRLVEHLIRFCPTGLRADAIAHRVVHGGPDAPQAAVIDQAVVERIQRYLPLAPQHNRAALELIESCNALFGGLVQIAVFDTAFFTRMPEWARIYALPYEWTQRGWYRIGFHGISHAWCLERVAELRAQSPDQFRLVTAHLGGGCSVAAVDRGVPVGCTMGFTALEGLPMATRSGSIDPGLILHLIVHEQIPPQELERILYHESGIFGVSGISADLRVVLQAARKGHHRAALAFDLFVDRVAVAIGGLATRMDGLDALCFTDRLGITMPELRSAVCTRLRHLGVRLDESFNKRAQPDSRVSADDSSVEVYVIRTREERCIARFARRCLAQEAR